MKIGYIGLGLMGKPCARNLIKGGQDLFIWARNPGKIQDLAALGARLCDSPADLASKVELIFTNLSDTPDVREVLLGPAGVIEGGRSGLIVVDMSTISALATRQMAEDLAKKGITLVDAPVSGGTKGAQDGTLTIMVGAEPDVFEKVKPVLSLMGAKITRIGGTGAGQVAKSCNQIMITANIMGVSEAFKLASALGVDLAPVREALLGGFAQSTVLNMHGLRMIEDNYEPGFKTVLHRKDMGIVAGLASELGLDMPASALGTRALEKTVEGGFGEEDSSAMYKIIIKKA
ncbi:NAD(P)-dependent oxidoreductase [Desulfovibrio sp. OttesenSCG-928-C14]|nr:NAD(P)-dependent oxidoreductase [Desulfovibrio sp. OttesenSCG-928-C14]